MQFSNRINREWDIYMNAAIISSDGNYRYMLSRSLGGSGVCLFIMLNPSIADTQIDDPTIRRCIGFANDWGFGELLVGNLFALRATNPQKLYEARDPQGSENDSYLSYLSHYADRVVCAWGMHGSLNRRGSEVLGLLHQSSIVTEHLGLTQSGQPKHPLYLRKTTPLIRF